MRKSTKKAFTLVELIVVITILAILATVAFISFGGQTSKAKNSKVTSDVSQIASKVNLLILDETKVADLYTSNAYTNDVTGTWAGILVTATNYNSGKINFFNLKEKEENFQDTTDKDNKKDYAYAYLAEDDVAVFNIGGQITDEANATTAVIKWTYYEATSDGNDLDSLISASGSSNVTGVLNGSGVTLY